MSFWILWIIGLVIAATALSTLRLALLRSSLSALYRQLEETGRPDAAAWLFVRIDSIVLSIALLQTAFFCSVFGVILFAVAARSSAPGLPSAELLLAGGLSVLILWVCSHVIAAAIARHAGIGLIATLLPVLRLVNVLGFPVARGYAFVDEVVRRLTGAAAGSEQAEQDLIRSIHDVQRRGGLDDAAAMLMENVVEFSSTDVGEVMTPRTDIEGIELTNDLAAIRAFIVEAGHSRIPVYSESLDQIEGILYVKDLVEFLGEDATDFTLKPLLRQPIIVPETKAVGELLSDFQRSEVHMAIVVDEYGGTSGLVTIEDVLEEIVGDIHDEHDPIDEEKPELITIAENQVEVDGRFHIDNFNQQLGLELPEEEEYDTVGGFLLAALGRVPEIGETYQSHDARFTAIAATPTQVQRIAVELLTPAIVNGEHHEQTPPAQTEAQS